MHLAEALMFREMQPCRLLQPFQMRLAMTTTPSRAHHRVTCSRPGVLDDTGSLEARPCDAKAWKRCRALRPSVSLRE